MIALLCLAVFCIGVLCYVIGKGAGERDVKKIKTYKPLDDDSRKRLREKLSK